METKHQHQQQHHHGVLHGAPAPQGKEIDNFEDRLNGLRLRGAAGGPGFGSVEHAALAAVVGELDAELRVEVSARIDRMTVELHREFTKRFDEFESRLDKLIEDSDPFAKMDARLLRLEEARLDLRLGALESAAHHSAVFVPPPSKLDASVASIQFSSQPPSKLDASVASMQFSSQPPSKPDMSPASVQFSSRAELMPMSPHYEGPATMSYLDSHTPLKPPSPSVPRTGGEPSLLDDLTLLGITACPTGQDTETTQAVPQQRAVPPPLADLDLTTRVEEMAKVARELLAGQVDITSASTNLMGTSQTNATSSSSGCGSSEAEDRSASAVGDAIATATVTGSLEPSWAPAPRGEAPGPNELKTIAAAAAAAAVAYGKGGGLPAGAALDWQPMISDELKSRLEGLVDSVKKTLGETRPQRGRSSQFSAGASPEAQQPVPQGLSPLKPSRIVQVAATSPELGVYDAGGSLSASVMAVPTHTVRTLSPVRTCSPVRGCASVVIPQAQPQAVASRNCSSAVIPQSVPTGAARVTEVHIGPPVLRSVSITRHRSPTRGASPLRGGSAVIAVGGRPRSPSPRRILVASSPPPTADGRELLM